MELDNLGETGALYWTYGDDGIRTPRDDTALFVLACSSLAHAVRTNDAQALSAWGCPRLP